MPTLEADNYVDMALAQRNYYKQQGSFQRGGYMLPVLRWRDISDMIDYWNAEARRNFNGWDGGTVTAKKAQAMTDPDAATKDIWTTRRDRWAKAAAPLKMQSVAAIKAGRALTPVSEANVVALATQLTKLAIELDSIAVVEPSDYQAAGIDRQWGRKKPAKGLPDWAWALLLFMALK